MTPTETDRFLAATRASAEAGLSLCSFDTLRLLQLLEEQGREILRLRSTVASPSASTSLPQGGSSGDHPEARALRDLARAYELDSSPALTRRLLEIADTLGRTMRIEVEIGSVDVQGPIAGPSGMPVAVTVHGPYLLDRLSSGVAAVLEVRR